MARKSKTDLVSQARDLIHGLNGPLAGVSEFVLGGVTYTRQRLIDELARVIDAAAKTREARAALAGAVGAEREVQKEVGALMTLFKSYVDARFGKRLGEKKQVGFAAKAPKTPTTETKAVAAEKRRAIREAKKAAAAPSPKKRAK